MPGPISSRSTPSRKKQHVDVTLTRDVRFRKKTTGLEKLDFINNALPEVNFSELDTTTSFLGHALQFPFMISCMTGGYSEAVSINRSLAEVCEETGIAMGVGSQRQALENRKYHKSFSVVRDVAKSIPVVGNIGAAEVVDLKNESATRIVDLVGADALAVHLNPLQEYLQPEGNTRFRGVLRGIERLCRDLSVPVVVKEIGAGISPEVARRLLDVGVRHIDVAGAGGTSWAGVEIIRGKRMQESPFWDWGIPLATALKEVSRIRSETEHFTLIASGGVGNGVEAAKCLVLGADMVASARNFLVSLKKQGKRGLRELVLQWGHELKGVMFLTGSGTIDELRRVPLVELDQ